MIFRVSTQVDTFDCCLLVSAEIQRTRRSRGLFHSHGFLLQCVECIVFVIDLCACFSARQHKYA